MYIVIRKKKFERMVVENAVLSSLHNIHTSPSSGSHDPQASCIIFSMDRALQLHALLSSYFENVKDPLPLHILYRTSSQQHRKSYEEVFSLFQKYNITAVYQKNKRTFRKQLLGIIGALETGKLLFLVDDIIVTENVAMHDFAKYDTRTAVPSLRMGANLSKAYTVQKIQRLPHFMLHAIEEEDKLCWFWTEGEHDWAYPLSVDGHLFSTREIGILAMHTEFDSPNTFEANLQTWVKYFKHRYGICYKKSKILNIPANRVQADIDNIHGAVHQDFLLAQWNRGMQMDYRALYGFVNESVHQDVTLTFIPRT